MSDPTGPPGRNLRPRLEFIEWRLFWEGRLNRSDLEEQFGISTPQASVDLRHYREVAGANIRYDATQKRFVAHSEMKPRFLRVSANRLLHQLRARASGVLRREDLWFSEIPPADVAPEMGRNVPDEVLRGVIQAIRTRRALSVHYQSLTGSRWRDIAPHAIAFDGHRWHARAWCCDRQEFRDFVLTRIERLGPFKPVSFDPKHDLQWTRKTTLRLSPHPGLTEEQSLAIQRDYGMHEGVREFEVRLSLAYYFIKRMNLDIEDLEPARAQIRLDNLDEVETAIRDAKSASKDLAEVHSASAPPNPT